jgi:hypothetical protein
MEYTNELPISDIKLGNNKAFENKLNKKIIQDLENYNKVSNAIKYGLKISEHSPSKVLILAYKDIYRLKEGFFNKAILFKEYFNEYEDNSRIGRIKFDWSNIENDEIDEFDVYIGNFSAYVLIFKKLYFFYFIEEIRSENEFYCSILKFIDIKVKDVSKNPFNYFLMDCMVKLVLEPEFSSMDIKEYVQLTIDLISTEMDKSKKVNSNNLRNNYSGIFSNKNIEEFIMFLLKENKKKKNKSFFSSLYRYLIKENFLEKDFERPRYYFSFLKDRDIFQFEPQKIITSSVSSEEHIFSEFDKLYTKFLISSE